VHSLPEILPQGRTQFWRSPSPGTTYFSNEEENNEEISDANNIQVPAPLLQPIGDDKLLHTNQISWSIGLTMSVMHEYSLCYVRSNVWPGAFTLGHAGYVVLAFNDLYNDVVRLSLGIIIIYMLVGDKNMNNSIHHNPLCQKWNMHNNSSRKTIQLWNWKMQLTKLDVLLLLRTSLVRKKIMKNYPLMQKIRVFYIIIDKYKKRILYKEHFKIR
jgi:hypothetical protein